MLRPRILTGLFLAVFAGIFASQVSSCTLDQEGTTVVETGKACTTDANCDDGNPCTVETCPQETKVCEIAGVPDGPAPAAAQTAADCKTVQCISGNPMEQDDAQDVLDDNNSCTDDVCMAGVPANNVSPDGSTCSVGTKTGTCATGVCEISCATNNDCDDGNPCSGDLCNTQTSKCVFDFIDGLPTPGAMEVAGDCKLHLCQNGMDTLINDDADVPDDQNPCTSDICTAGVPSNPNRGDGEYCVPGENQVCDGNGACVECTTASHCVNIVETECEKRSCVNNACQIAYEGTNTLASPTLQTPANCKKIVCNGNMGTTEVADDADLPVDGNACTKDVCTNGTPSNPFEALNTTCGAGGLVCNATGVCVGCNMADQCSGTDDFCKQRTCNGGQCGFNYTAVGTDLPTGQTAGDCKVIECGAMGTIITSPLTTDVPVDGNACTQDLCSAQGAPSNPPTAINSPCSVGANDACDGNGTCKKSNSKTCATGNDCVSTFCADGVCCNSTCTAECRSCNVTGSIGTCSAVPFGTEDGTCTGNNACNINADCDSKNGQGCSGGNSCLSGFCADGVCCNEACGAECKACNLAGSVGMCGNIASGLQDNAPVGICTGSNQCDGAGVCKKILGATCGGTTECLSGFCVDGVCCNNACTNTCRACNVSGSVGNCSNIPSGQTDNNPANTCTGSNQCDGGGGCKKVTGTSCGAAAECLTGFCVDGFCCNSICGAACTACSAMLSTGPNGTCSPVDAGTDPDDDCTDQMASSCGNNGLCDGAGACQKYPVGTVCIPESCTGSTQTNDQTCDNMQMCVSGGTTDCAPYTCNGNSCATTCSAQSDCVTTHYCETMACVMKKDTDAPCNMGYECISNNCSGNPKTCKP